MLRARWDRVTDLTPREVSGLTELLDRHFLGVEASQVAADLLGKSVVVRLFLDGVLCGFSTIRYERLEHGGEDIGALWSGDTISDPSVWHSPLLAVAWCGAVQELHRNSGRLAWCLICSGLRTWAFMPTCITHYAPRPQASTELYALRDRLASQVYGELYRDGIVRLAKPQRLRPHLAGAPKHRSQDSSTAFFLKANPGHQEGDELACATWLGEQHLTRLGKRLWQAGSIFRDGPCWQHY